MSGMKGLRLYRLASTVLAPFLPLWLGRRVRAGKEEAARLGERYGRSTIDRPDGPLIWLHGASVGETQMLLPLIDKFLAHNADVTVLVTSGTRTSAELLAKQLPTRAIHQYLPADTPGAVRRFFAHWQPELGILAESELWPNLIIEAGRREIPLALINARMSEASLSRWQKRPQAARTLLSNFRYIHAANEMTAAGLTTLSGQPIEPGGNLKHAAPPLSVGAAELARFQKALGNRPVWCAASTHKGEEEIILTAAREVLQARPDALLLLAPRHPERADDIAKLIETHGLSYGRHAGGGTPGPGTQVWLVDTMGEMGLIYRLSDIAFVGGSLCAGLKGHNPLEPARLDCAILTGRHISSFANIYLDLFRFGAAGRVLAPEKLGKEIIRLFADDAARLAMRKQAKDFALAQSEILAHVWDGLMPLLEGRNGNGK